MLAGDASNREQLRNEKRRLRNFLCITDQLEDNYADFSEPRAEGSCEWLTQKANFRRWCDSADARVFCLTGNPATGKSFLAQYVVEHLTGLSCDCSYYFFKEGDKLKSALSKSLLSLAYQMASSNVRIRESILEMQNDDVQIDTDNHQSIWKKLFVGKILQLPASKTHYWVLDALDECKNFIDLLPLITKTNSTFPLRIFVTSRPSLELQSHLQPMDPPAEMQHILPEHTLDDIRRYVESHTDFPSMQEHTTQQLVATILEKSEGCFLWVRLVLKELRKVYSARVTRRILEDVPQGMDKLYHRTLETISTTMASYGKPLAKAVLIWAVCSVRSLTTTELKHALELDINDTVPNLESQIATLCGHLVYVDSQLRIKMIHQTARNFLLSTDTRSEFAFKEEDGHRQLAMACLRCLLADEMKTPRSRRPSAARLSPQRSPFLEYAAKSFYEHINRTSSEDQGLLNMLYAFLSSRNGNVQSWIEYIAADGDLNHLIQTGMVLKTYVKRRAKHFPALGKDIKMVESWSIDLTRIVAKFGYNLLRLPSSIYHIIPPFCPREAAPYRQFGRSARGIQVLGISSTTWDDCLACIIYRNSTTTSVACSGGHFAIGTSNRLANRLVRLYHTATCQEIGKLEHGEPIKHLEFNFSGQLLASAGRRSVRVWDVADKEPLWSYKTASPCIAMSFMSDNKTLILACHDNHIYFFDLVRGTCSESQPWYMDANHASPIYKTPYTAAFSLEHDLLAFVYRGGHINLWNWKDGYFVGTCEKPSAGGEILPFHASSLVFNPAANTDSLAAAYEAGELIVFDPLEGDVKATYKADADSQTLACSPDGRSLVSGDSSGTIRIFDFETFDSAKLKLLHIIYGRGNNIRAMAFCSDSLRFVDIRNSQSNVWEPAALVRANVGEALTDTVSVDVQEIELPEAKHIDKITDIVAEPRGDYVFCGTENGLITVFETRRGEQCQTLYQHSSGISVTKLVLEGTKSIIASADLSSRVLVLQLALVSSEWKITSHILDHRMTEPVEQLLYSPDGTKILIVTTTKDTLCALSGEVIASVTWTTRNRGIWVSHPQRPTQLLLVVGSRVQIYDWNGLQKLSAQSGIELDFELPQELEIRCLHTGWNGHVLATEYSARSRNRSPIRLLLWDTSRFAIPASSISPRRELEPFVDRLAQLIGTFGMIVGMMRDNILFLDHDGWICSVKMEDSVPRYYKRHFFLPYDWLSTSAHLLIGCTVKDEVVFGKEGELAIIKKGLDCVEQMPFGPEYP
jgi:WD40 repeat protein